MHSSTEDFEQVPLSPPLAPLAGSLGDELLPSCARSNIVRSHDVGSLSALYKSGTLRAFRETRYYVPAADALNEVVDVGTLPLGGGFGTGGSTGQMEKRLQQTLNSDTQVAIGLARGGVVQGDGEDNVMTPSVPSNSSNVLQAPSTPTMRKNLSGRHNRLQSKRSSVVTQPTHEHNNIGLRSLGDAPISITQVQSTRSSLQESATFASLSLRRSPRTTGRAMLGQKRTPDTSVNLSAPASPSRSTNTSDCPSNALSSPPISASMIIQEVKLVDAEALPTDTPRVDFNTSHNVAVEVNGNTGMGPEDETLSLWQAERRQTDCESAVDPKSSAVMMLMLKSQPLMRRWGLSLSMHSRVHQSSYSMTLMMTAWRHPLRKLRLGRLAYCLRWTPTLIRRLIPRLSRAMDPSRPNLRISRELWKKM
ncbi:hypothetical protein M427DRAFT_439501 [Gonapodya prolifera JEL478]|uniref:Uncharacterized protein n=1 Tax=Gonapodya prolifera (strain JEL478) TaxID=1344416 RepID=A0A139A3M3_GONPJ|nr:hypothetical protein M427DRAFT_439501 [Gonapodya prolifera JEL478]|eukprot:KXS11380.1 hypothetical protein M427DRAFT_439501 [Gonapodya prolifera JEL478]